MTKIDPDAVHEFPRERTAECYALAKRMAKYGRRAWLVWWLADGTHYAAKLRPESLKRAMAESVGGTRPGREGYFSCLQANDGCGLSVSPGLAGIWLANMEAGYFAY